ncbi:hypothetical protein HX866_25955 [Pseudomonas gingeri]|uniref:hypothetical protein n=1 Tax=Pseudomonas gingeri TaxID=117681 RepID=UPI0015A309E1|nr:hypothetical protein [Pseudomonas gingeri]NWA28343.1 hypothetical protein [Pseudomonas gingeri]
MDVLPVALLSFSIAMLIGCSTQNFRPPEAASLECDPSKSSAACPLIKLDKSLRTYINGAELNTSTLDIVALGGAATGAVGLAIGAHSDLYKSAGAIIASSVGLKAWGNYDEQVKVSTDARKKLRCAITQIHIMENGKTPAEGAHLFREKVTAFDNKLKSIRAARNFANETAEIESIKTQGLSNYLIQDAAKKNYEKDAASAQQILEKLATTTKADAELLQETVRSSIKDNSFKTADAIKYIYPASSTPAGADLLNKTLAFSSTESPVDAAIKIIDAFNKYRICMPHDPEPELPAS